MEILLFLVISVVVTYIKHISKQKENTKQSPSTPHTQSAPIPLDPLQELLRKFEENQKKNSQEFEEEFDKKDFMDDESFDEMEKRFDDDEDFNDSNKDIDIQLPEAQTPKEVPSPTISSTSSDSSKPIISLASKTSSEVISSHKTEGTSILEKVAYFTISQNFISENKLIQKFQIGNAMASSLIQKMEYLGICGKNMGETDRSVLVSNESELINILKRDHHELHQNEVFSIKPTKSKFVFNKKDAVKGVLWSKILDEPRFRKRWTPQSR